MQAKEVMTTTVISVFANETVLKAAQLMLENRISGLPVVDTTGKLVGVVTEGDFLVGARLARNDNGQDGWNSRRARTARRRLRARLRQHSSGSYDDQSRHRQ